MSSDHQNKLNRNLTLALLVIVAGAFGFGYALVPLYDVFCEITGFGGRTNATAAVVEEAPDLSREIRIEFVTTVNSYAPFEFAADVDSMTVHPGKMYYATFTAKKSHDNRQSCAGGSKRRARCRSRALHQDRMFLLYEPGIHRQ